MLQLTQLMEKREEVHMQILAIEQSALKIAAEAAFVVSVLGTVITGSEPMSGPAPATS